MTYRVLDNQEMNWADPRPQEALTETSGPAQPTYAKMIETACNAMERDGYTLVSVIHSNEPDTANPHTFVFHKANRQLEDRPV